MNKLVSKFLENPALVEAITGTAPTENSKWHSTGLHIRARISEKKLKKLQRRVQDRINYHADVFKSSTFGAGTRHQAEVHFMQMLKMHHLLSGLQGKSPKATK